MRIKHYILTFFILLSGFIFGQDVGFKKAAISSSFSSVQVNAYQESADKKIEDFYSYLNLLSNLEISQQAKAEIRENILLLFKDSNTEVVDFTSENKKIALSVFLDTIESKKIKFKLTNKKESVSKLFNDFWFSDCLVEIELNGEKSVKNISQKIYFSPVYKQFGNNVKEVWEIKLGEIKKATL